MEEILHQLICSSVPLFVRFFASQAVQDFFHQQYHGVEVGVVTSPKTKSFAPEHKINKPRPQFEAWVKGGLGFSGWEGFMYEIDIS